LERVVGTFFALTVLATSFSVAADPGPQGVKPRALAPVSRALLDAADANGDAQVSTAELESLVQRHIQEQVQQRFRRLDRNADGRVSRSEVPSMKAARFARFDLDGNAFFTVAELAQVMEVTARRRCELVVARLDADGDGALTARDLDSRSSTEVASTLELPTLHLADARSARRE
jgi:Ca2+-binding EF-hand superfamily protein